MTKSYRVLIPLLIVMFGAAAVAQGQVDNQVELRAVGGASTVDVTVDLDIGGVLPAEWVGWVVQRGTVGPCEPTVDLAAPAPFPAGAQTYVLTDHGAVEGITYYYRILAVDDQGGRHYLGGPPAFSPAYYHDDYASLNGNGAVARGLLTDLGWTVGVDVCSGFCWSWISFISEPPPELVAGAGSPAVVIIYGTIDNEFEGPYIATITDWAIVGGCGTVSDQETSWSDLKASYR